MQNAYVVGENMENTESKVLITMWYLEIETPYLVTFILLRSYMIERNELLTFQINLYNFLSPIILNDINFYAWSNVNLFRVRRVIDWADRTVLLSLPCRELRANARIIWNHEQSVHPDRIMSIPGVSNLIFRRRLAWNLR